MVVYTCPECGCDLVFSQILTSPPINVAECKNCGYLDEQPEHIERVVYDPSMLKSIVYKQLGVKE